ncbi:MAG: HAD-IA family hydrolase [Verrucomicrobiae bacterium]|nr:HAD-IA family hydrolase [Verrucomicrobiae bacterium]
MMPVRAVFFDVGGTLLEPWPSVGVVYARVARRFGLPDDPVRLEAAFRDAFRAVPPIGGLTSSCREWWEQVVRTVFGDLPAGFFDALYDEFSLPGAWRVLPEVRAALAWARQQGWHLGIISNWDDRLRPLLQRLALTNWDSVTISCEVGVEKPHPAIFQSALTSAGVPAETAVHFGDSLEDDIAGAEAVGMRAVHVEHPGQLPEVLFQLPNRDG